MGNLLPTDKDTSQICSENKVLPANMALRGSKMQASPTKIIEYFNGQKQNLIPLFQRPYSWGRKHWETFWDDIKIQYESENASAHFMGAIVSVPARSVPVGVNKHLIIDGQQRLTTFSVLLCALRDSADFNTSSKINDVYLINQHSNLDDKLKFLPTHQDRAAYKTLVIDRTRTEGTASSILNAYDFFKKKLCEDCDEEGRPIQAEKIMETLADKLEVVMINLGEDDDPYLIFESLNAKGEPLSQADLVRNFILMRFKHSIAAGGEQQRIYDDYWQPIQGSLGERLTDYLRHYLIKDGAESKRSNIYLAAKDVFNRCRDDREVEEKLASLLQCARYYASFLDPRLEADKSVAIRLDNLREIGVTTLYPLALRLFEERSINSITSNDLEKCLMILESYLIRRLVCGIPANSLNKTFNTLSRTFPGGDHLDWLQDSLSNVSGAGRFPTDDEFETAFINQPQYGRANTKYILIQIEKSHLHKEAVAFGNLTIEHIMPQTLSEEWVQKLGELSDNIHEIWKHTFGNLTLTAYNSELGNSALGKKMDLLAKSHLEINRSLAQHTSWGNEEIEARAKTLFSYARSIWPFPGRKSA